MSRNRNPFLIILLVILRQNHLTVVSFFSVVFSFYGIKHEYDCHQIRIRMQRFWFRREDLVCIIFFLLLSLLFFKIILGILIISCAYVRF